MLGKMAHFRLQTCQKIAHLQKAIVHTSCLLSLDNGFSPFLMDKTELLVPLAPCLMLHYSEVSLSAPTPRGLL